MDKDYYFILGVSPSSTTDAIKKAYRINAIKYHPDKNFGDPEFTKKFLEIKEAYDNLINSEKRREFDSKYSEFFTNKSDSETNNYHNKQKEKKEEEEKFKYDPYVKFFSSYDRDKQETPPYPPRQNPLGKTLPDNAEFFILPKKIGKIVGGATNVFKGKKIETPFSLFIGLLKPGLIILVTIFIFGFLHYLYLKNANKENPLQYVLILWSIIAAILIFLICKINIDFSIFYGFNYFIGVNGFAFYKFKDSKVALIESIEINFNEVTDIFSSYATKEFAWVNRYSKKVIYSEPAPDEKIDDIKFDLNRHAEKYFTIYLLDNMEKQLESRGYVEFILAPSIPYIRLGIGFITFLKGEELFTYKFNDIKRIYTQEMQLYIEHTNYQKVLFFKSGNQNSIPLQFLCNRQFFYKAMEILVGYKIN
jgi:hypothetical protein